MRLPIHVIALAFMALIATLMPVQAQEQVWIQIEAQPTLPKAEERAQAYMGVFNNVVGYQLRSGWFGILVGPYSPETAPAQLAALKSERLIPADSYVTDGATFVSQFWPVALDGAVALAPSQDNPALADIPVLEEPAAPVDETLAEARDSEKALDESARQNIQLALQWFGHYKSVIDGDFGPGTRDSMALWQEANGFDVTGVLTTNQRGELLATWSTAVKALGLETITEAESGIEITLPMALVTFDHYEPPFVHYREKADSGLRIILISQPGDQSSLDGLYDTLQTLEVIPPEGPRERGENSFTISGNSADLNSYTYVEQAKGLIKGYMLIWNPQKPGDIARIKDVLQASFKPIGDRALDPGMVPLADTARRGLMAGLEVRKPEFSRSGFYVDGAGTVLTTAEAVQNCARITLDLQTDADLVLSDPASGLAVLKPKTALAPRSVAALATNTGQPGAEVAVAGYSYEDRLPAPTLTFGTFEEAKGLNGETGIARFTMDVLAGDAGGPVLDGTGSVLGLLLPRATDGARQLPPSVQYAAPASVLAAVLAKAAIPPLPPAPTTPLPPEELNRVALGMTVLVSCWN